MPAFVEVAIILHLNNATNGVALGNEPNVFQLVIAFSQMCLRESDF